MKKIIFKRKDMKAFGIFYLCILSYILPAYTLQRNNKFQFASLVLKSLGLIYTRWRLAAAARYEDAYLRARRAKRKEWPMTPSGRIPSAHASWPLLRAKKV